MTLARFVVVAAFGFASLPVVAVAQQAHPGEDIEHPPIGEEHTHHDEQQAAPAVQLPLRIIGTLSAGASLRVVIDPALRETVFAPAYLEARGGVVFPGSGMWRHGALLGVATNLSPDGPVGNSYRGLGMGPLAMHGRAQGMDQFNQWVLTPSYLAYFRLSEDFVVTARVGVPFVLSPYLLMGFEAGASIAWMITAGFGLFAEASFDIWLGEDTFPYPTASVGGGVVIDYEVLP